MNFSKKNIFNLKVCWIKQFISGFGQILLNIELKQDDYTFCCSHRVVVTGHMSQVTGFKKSNLTTNIVMLVNLEQQQQQKWTRQFIVSLLLSAHAKRFSVSCMWDLCAVDFVDFWWYFLDNKKMFGIFWNFSKLTISRLKTQNYPQGHVYLKIRFFVGQKEKSKTFPKQGMKQRIRLS